VTGGCRCGRVRLRVAADPLLTAACHCTGCQTMTASAFSLTIALPREGLVVESGELVRGGLQANSEHNFCSFCKTWVFTHPHGLDWMVALRASTLDDHAWFEPFAEFWTREKLRWAVTPARFSYETVPAPEEFEPLMRAYAETRT
jgi:hypothetical protein